MIIEYHISQRIDVGNNSHFVYQLINSVRFFINKITYKYMHFQKVVSYLQMESSYSNISYDFSDGIQHYFNNIFS